MSREKVLLHICCAPDATTAIKRLGLKYEVIGCFDNSNIFPYSEYKKRLRAAEKLCNIWKIKLIVPEYDYSSWKSQMKGLEDLPEKQARCRKCIFMNLKSVAWIARENDIENFTSSLSTSPKKDVLWISRSGNEASKLTGIKYVDEIFRKKNGYLSSIFYTRLLELYRQGYCGCEYSIGNC